MRKAALILAFLLSFVLVLNCCSGDSVSLMSFMPEVEGGIDFEGFEFGIMTNWWDTWDPLTSTSETALSLKDDAVIAHNQLIQEKYNCVIKTYESGYVVTDIVPAQILSGTATWSILDTSTQYMHGFTKANLLTPWSHTDLDLTNYAKYGPAGYMEGSSYDGEVYGIWSRYWEGHIEYFGMLAVNNELLHKFVNINVHEMKESGDWTFDGFKNLVSACTADIGRDSVDPITVYNDYIFSLCAILSNGGNIVEFNEKTGKYEYGLDSPAATRAFEYASTMYDEHLVVHRSDNTGGFGSRQDAVFALTASWLIVGYMENMKDIDIICFPYGPDVEYGSTYGTYYSEQGRYLSCPITADADQTAKFMSLWLEPLEEYPYETLISDYKTTMFFNEESTEEFFGMEEYAKNVYFAQIYDVFGLLTSGLYEAASSNRIAEKISSIENAVTSSIDENMNN